MNAPFQLDLMPDNPLFGLQVKIERQKACCGDIALIGHGKGPHYAELICASCGRHRGWLSKKNGFDDRRDHHQVRQTDGTDRVLPMKLVA